MSFLKNIKTPEQLEAEAAQRVLDQQLSDAHNYLNSTDYVVIKLNEALVLGEDITAMKAEYVDVLAEREVKRQFIRENS